MIWTPLFRSTEMTESSVVDLVIFFTFSQNFVGIAQACRKHTQNRQKLLFVFSPDRGHPFRSPRAVSCPQIR